jgi:aryl-phospho-beta-D-glucosidase BglC (GH1 family)
MLLTTAAAAAAAEPRRTLPAGFGFNVAMGMVDGLWAGGTDLATDFGKITYQLKLLGYNAVRLPFTWNNLANTKVWDLRRQCTPTSAAQLKQRLVDPADWASNSGKALPANPSAIGNTATGTCNDYLPSARNEDRLLYVMQQFINMGMYVVLDYQPMGTEEHAYNLDRFVGAWAALWKKISCLPNFSSELAGRVLVDVMNEPDSMGIRWEAQGDRPGAQQLYLGTADALWAATPGQVRFLFEGTGQNSFGLNWGNGFVTDINVINSRGLSNPNAFFTYLVNKQYSKYGVSCLAVRLWCGCAAGASGCAAGAGGGSSSCRCSSSG